MSRETLSQVRYFVNVFLSLFHSCGNNNNSGSGRSNTISYEILQVYNIATLKKKKIKYSVSFKDFMDTFHEIR